MHIHEAMKQAIEKSCGIVRADIPNAVIIPVHMKNPIDVYISGKNGHRAPNWNPTPEELMADNWEITKV